MDKQDSHLNCYGCAHSTALDPYPSKPSGERPCHFCTRNENRDLTPNCWYDGSEAVKVPMDCYHSVDIVEQMNKWEEGLKKEIERLRKVIQERNRQISTKNKAINDVWEQSYNEVKFERDP